METLELEECCENGHFFVKASELKEDFYRRILLPKLVIENHKF